MMDALAMTWQATCDECKLTVEQTFEGLQRAGWICRADPRKEANGEQPHSWYCPGCVLGLKRPAQPPA